MIDLVCPECGDEMEIDPADLEGAESIGCEACDAEIAFTMVGGIPVLGEVLEPGVDICDDCNELIADCICTGDVDTCDECGELIDDCTCPDDETGIEIGGEA